MLESWWFVIVAFQQDDVMAQEGHNVHLTMMLLAHFGVLI